MFFWRVEPVVVESSGACAVQSLERMKKTGQTFVNLLLPSRRASLKFGRVKCRAPSVVSWIAELAHFTQMKFLVVTSGPCLSLESCRWYDVQPSDGFVSSCLSSLAVPNLGVCGPMPSERSPDLLDEVLSVKKFLKRGFKQGMQAQMMPVPTSTTDHFIVDTDPMVTSRLSTPSRTLMRRADATVANSPTAKSNDTMYFCRAGSLSLQNTGSGRVHNKKSVKMEKAVVK
jgi:hypothetical protein